MLKFTDLQVWQKSHQLTLNVYRISKNFPNEEKFGLTSQLRRAALSIELNIVEGNAKFSHKDFRRFLYISLGSCSEVKCSLIVAKDLKYITETNCLLLVKYVDEIEKMIYGLMKTLKPRKSN